MNNSLISVIIPIYNVEQYINQCVDSILNQTYKNLEIILVDDGSPDNCPQICDDYARKDNRVKVIHKKNGGLSSARNAGMDISTGEYLCFVDSDDYWNDNEFISKLIDNISNKDFIYFSYKNVSEKSIDTNIIDNRLIKEYFNGEDFLNSIFDINPIFNWYAWQYLFKTNVWKINNIRFPENTLYEDTATIYKAILLSKECSILDLYSYCYRNRKTSITQKHNVKGYIHHLNVCDNAINDINGRNEISRDTKRKLNNCFASTYYAVVNELSLLSKNEKDILIKALKNKKDMMNYTYTGKQLYAKLLVKVFGIEFSSHILGFRRHIKYGN